jgi:diguanylate cyclase (GGDEF)-like protein
MQEPVRILYAEDDDEVRLLTEYALARDGFDVRAFACGESLLDEAAGLHPDLLLLDVRLPGMDGIETLRRLRELPSLGATPAVFVTAARQPAELAVLRAAGASDIVIKPFEAGTLGRRLRRLVAPVNGATASLEPPAPEFAERLPERLGRIRAALGGDDGQPLDHGTLLLELHRLAGSAGTFGFVALGEQAAATERRFETLLAVGAAEGQIRAEVGAAVDELQRLADAGPSTGASCCCAGAADALPTDRVQTLFTLTTDSWLAMELSRRLDGYGYRSEAFTGCRELHRAMLERPPSAVLVDGDLSDMVSHCEMMRGSPVPLLFLSERDDWHSRLVAFRAGARGFVAKPVEFASLVEAVDRLTSATMVEAFRVLVVDDDSTLAAHYVSVLRAAGMDAQALEDPTQLLDRLADFRPELLLMDLHMPGCSGVEAAGVVRQETGYDGLPIIFLSGERRVEEQLDALRAGGDEFLLKPILDEHLIAAVSIRARRFRTLNGMMLHDGLTGLFNQISIKLRLEELLPLAARRHAPLAFAMLDVDLFKQVNDRFGHPAGDRVLRGLSRLLERGLRRSDIVGRFGGEEFAVIMPDTEPEAACQVLDALRERFAGLVQQCDGERFKVTFSGGIASAADFNQVESLIRAADQALYRAKAEGRNRICGHRAAARQ